MSKRSPAPRQAGVAGTLEVNGTIRTVTAATRDVALPPIRIILSGGTSGRATRATVTVQLNVPATGSDASLIVVNEVISGRRRGNTIVFPNVVFSQPGPRVRRVIRIVNLRGNASQLGVSGSSFVVPPSTPTRPRQARRPLALTATVSIATGDGRSIRLEGATQRLADVTVA